LILLFRAMLLTALLSLWPAAVEADIDVTVPPGLPPEWVRFLPSPVLTDLGLIPRRRQATQQQGSVTSVPQERRAGYTGGVDSSFGFSGILTIDLPLHFNWAVSKITLTPKYRPLTGSGAKGEGWRYPPEFPLHLYWLSIATMLRRAVHPALVSSVGTVEYLILIGEPAYIAARNSRGEGALRWIAKEVERQVGPFPTGTPRASGGMNPYQKLIHKLALVELASGFPYSPARRFARRLMSLAGEGLTPVLHYSRQKHLFVRRNAVSLLAKYPNQQASVRLRELLRSRDRVIRNRALQALVDRRDLASAPWLRSALRKNDRGLQFLAATALGKLRDVGAIKQLVSYASNNRTDPDALWAAVPAIGRIGKPNKKVLRLLVGLERQLRGNRLQFGQGNPIYPPPVRDRLTKADVIAQMCRISRMALGDPVARKALLEEIRQGRGQAKKAKATDRRGNLIRQRGNVLKAIASPNLFLVCDILRRQGSAGNKLLLEVVNDAIEQPAVRAYALEQVKLSLLLSFLESIEKLAELARTSDVGLIRARSLALLELRDVDTAVETSRRILLDYSINTSDYPAMRREWVVIPAMRLLGRRSVNQVAVLVGVIRRAAEEQAEGERRRKALTHKVKGGRNGQVPLVSVPPIVEAALIELGRIGSQKAVKPLLKRLADPDRIGRGEAALALGAIGGKQVIGQLVGALEDKDAWVRFCSYRSLRSLTEVDFFCDWIFGAGTPSIDSTVRKWKAWYRKKYPK